MLCLALLNQDEECYKRPRCSKNNKKDSNISNFYWPAYWHLGKLLVLSRLLGSYPHKLLPGWVVQFQGKLRFLIPRIEKRIMYPFWSVYNSKNTGRSVIFVMSVIQMKKITVSSRCAIATDVRKNQHQLCTLFKSPPWIIFNIQFWKLNLLINEEIQAAASAVRKAYQRYPTFQQPRPNVLNRLYCQVLIYNSSIENQESVPYDEEAAVFFLELLIRVVLQNR